MGFTAEQLRAIEAQGKVIVSASAGSGKTTVMIEKIIRLITSGVGVDEILAVTFTKKAAAQMKEKLSKALIAAINESADEATRSRLKKQLSGVPGADISTIHAYCSNLIKRHFYVAQVDSGFRIVGGDDADGRALKNAALDELLEEGYESGEEEFSHLLSCYWRKKKDTALRKIILTTYSSLRDRAEYRAFLEGIAQGYSEEDFDKICRELLALFQEKCRYYYQLVEDETAYFMTIEESAQKQLALCRELTEWLTSYAYAPDYFAAAAIEKPKLTAKSTSKKDSKEKLRHVERLAFLRNRIVKMQEGEFGKLLSRDEERNNFLLSGKTAAALAKYLLLFDEKYAEKKRERGVLDYNDLEHKALTLLRDPEIAAETQKKYRYVFVDEYQDVNPVQESVIAKLAADNLFLVGDVKQAIYGFRGSKSKFFVQKQAEFASGAGKSLNMTYNFRSEDKVLDAVNAQFSLAMTPRVCDVDYARDSRMEKGGRYEANGGKVQIHFVEKEEKSAPVQRGVYSVVENTEKKEEGMTNTAIAMAQVIREELNGYLRDPSTGEKRKVRYGDIAVLTRKKRGDITEEVEALTELGLPVSTESAVNICAFPEIKALTDILSLLDNAEQDIPLCSALLSRMGKLSADDLAEIRLAYRGVSPFRAACKLYAREKKDGIAQKLKDFYGYFDALRTEACVLEVGEVLSKLLADTQMEADLLARKNGRACVKRIRRFLEEATAFDGSSVHDFLTHLRNLDYKIDYCENGGEDSIKVLTMHSSKGLEFPIVLLPNLNKDFRGGEATEVYVEENYGLAPRAFNGEKMLRYSTLLRKLFEVKEEKSALSDELNLYYVAMTRAERHLHLFFNERPPMPDVKYAKSYAELTDFDAWEEYIVADTLFDVKKQERQTLLRRADEEKVQEIVRAYTWQYAHTGYENLPVKSSPTQLMEGGRCAPKQHFKEYGSLEKEEEIDETNAAERDLAVREGTAYHAFLERFDFALLTDGQGNPISKTQLETLVESALAALDEREVEISLLDKKQLVAILSNPVFYDLQGCTLYKEQQFLVSLPVKDTYAKTVGADARLASGEEEMLFQGAIDLLAVGEEVRIIDYKYSVRGAEELKTHYLPQLRLYKLAAAKIMGIDGEKIRCSIVNIRRGFQVDL